MTSDLPVDAAMAGTVQRGSLELLSHRIKRNGERSGGLTAWIVGGGPRPLHILVWSLSSDGDAHDHFVDLDWDSRTESGPK